MAPLIYDNRFFRGLLYVFGRIFLRLGGWKLNGAPPNLAKYVAIAAPHTSNWDFPIFIALVGACRMRVRFFGKHTLFEGPLGWLFTWLGGIPVRRGSRDAAGLIETAVELYREEDQLILGIAPEGTRSQVQTWKSGFYRIAVSANVPIVLAYLDANSKEIGFGQVFYPTGDKAADLKEIQRFYESKQGIKAYAK